MRKLLSIWWLILLCILPIAAQQKRPKKPPKKVPVEECLKMQGRFKHLGADEIKDIQKHVDESWDKLLKLEESKLKIF